MSESRGHRSGRTPRVRIAVLAALLVLLPPARSAAAQEPSPAPPLPRDTTGDLTLFERLNLDKLRFSAIGISLGAVKPTQMEATQAFAVHADYGKVAERWNVIFSVTYWGSRYSPETLRTFRDTLANVIVDTTGDYRFEIGRITVRDIAFGTELRWAPTRARATVIRPYLGGGMAAHVINAEGRAIAGTFVERALDNITAGILGVAGVDIAPLPHFSAGVQARYDFLSGARFGSLRLVGTYILDAAPPVPNRP